MEVFDMNTDESMLDVYIYETQQLLQSMEDTLFAGESEKKLNVDHINEVFRVMHTIKGASSMMEFEEMSKLAHILEDMFSQIRDKGAPEHLWPAIFDLAFAGVSFFNGELAKLLEKAPLDGDATELEDKVRAQLGLLKGDACETNVQTLESAPVPEQERHDSEQATGGAPGKKDAPYYKVKLSFEENCQMEGLRAFGVVQGLKNMCVNIATLPENLDVESASEEIRNKGLRIFVQTNENPDIIRKSLETTLFMQRFSLIPLEGDEDELPESMRRSPVAAAEHAGHMDAPNTHTSDNPATESIAKQNFISVNVNKLDNLLNIVGEIVTAQSMVMGNADFGQTEHDSFDAAARQLHALINELQDVVMNIRMMPVSTLFQKMRRLVRDMGKKFGKDIELVLIGEETEVDKNVIDYLSD
ncbi:MAG: hypothetical protein EOM14_10265, partial [Clostridia bacterium]|nr:hypothetical protein [Clostridia bacterium]